MDLGSCAGFTMLEEISEWQQRNVNRKAATQKAETLTVIRGQRLSEMSTKSVTHALLRLFLWAPVSMVTTLGVYHEDKVETQILV